MSKQTISLKTLAVVFGILSTAGGAGAFVSRAVAREVYENRVSTLEAQRVEDAKKLDAIDKNVLELLRRHPIPEGR